jgi:hypothetical protein
MTGLAFGVVLSPEWLRMALADALLAARTRQANGVRETTAHREFVQALHQALAQARQYDVAEIEPVQSYPQTVPTVTIEQAATMLELSKRQTQRLAPQLGGKIIAGRWLLDADAIAEHLEGRKTA